MGTERRAACGEIRVEGRRISGTVMVYDEVSPSHRERFLPGAFRLADSVHLDLGHDPERVVAWHPGGGLDLHDEDGAMILSAEVAPIPAGDRALDEIRTGATAGLSVEFRALRESQVDNVRVIQEAILSGIGIVGNPSYAGSRVEARNRRRRVWL